MKQSMKVIFAIIIMIASSGIAMAFNIDALDRVNVLMTKSQVISLLGTPDQTDELRGGLKVEIYNLKNMAPMVGTGCIYEDDTRLAGQTFIFQGEMGKEAAERLKILGFVVTEEKEGMFRLLGKDDDTGQPLMVHIGHSDGLTVVTTFEKGFYDRRVK